MYNIRIATLLPYGLAALCSAFITTSTIASDNATSTVARDMEEENCSSTESEEQDSPGLEEKGARPLVEFGVKKPGKINKDARFRCPVVSCGSSYLRRYDLKKHLINKHPDQVPSHPEICQTQKSSKLNKNWQCPVGSCPSGYSRKGDLKQHLREKHQKICKNYPDVMVSKSTKVNKLWPCRAPGCECGYKRKFDLKSHIELKHPEMNAM